jgi:oxalate decarboxylase/phosphoglucose isomerase-like protein (cupin superfamily)
MNKLEYDSVSTQLFDWGRIKWRVSPDEQPGASMTFGDVVLYPGKGHDRHEHPDADEIIYVIAGTGEQMINDVTPFPIAAGDVFYIPRGVFHSTKNIGWSTLHLVVVYNPGGAERALRDLPDFREIEAGRAVSITNETT